MPLSPVRKKVSPTLNEESFQYQKNNSSFTPKLKLTLSPIKKKTYIELISFESNSKWH